MYSVSNELESPGIPRFGFNNINQEDGFGAGDKNVYGQPDNVYGQPGSYQ